MDVKRSGLQRRGGGVDGGTREEVLADARAAGATLAQKAQAAVQAAGAALTVSISESGCVVAGCEASSIEPSSVLMPAMGATLPSACAWSVIICGRQHMSAFSSTERGTGQQGWQIGRGRRQREGGGRERWRKTVQVNIQLSSSEASCWAAAADADEQMADAHAHAPLAAHMLLPCSRQPRWTQCAAGGGRPFARAPGSAGSGEGSGRCAGGSVTFRDVVAA